MQLTPKQQEAMRVLAGPAMHVMLEGGSRSGKTFLLTRAVVFRALKAPKSRHGIFRFRFNHLRASIIEDTFPRVMEVCFPEVPYDLDRSDWFVAFSNGATIWFGGLDEKERTEKILGQELATAYLNEISQIPFASRNLVVTRLAQRVEQEINGRREPLVLRMYYDLNPTTKSHWAYQLFHLKRDPESKTPLPNPEQYAHFRLNPVDNIQNLAAGYLDTLKGLSSRLQRRFMEGEWADANPNALFAEEWIDRNRVLDGKVPDMVRIVVAVDPSGSGDEDNADNDEIGIAVVGLGTDGVAYVLEDASVKAGPATWGAVATGCYDRHQADVIVGEQNFGGEMVRMTIQTARPRTPYKKVVASRGKVQRAEPFSSLYEQGKVRHVGHFPKLEEELAGFTTFGYTGEGSPNRADAVIWALAELFPSLVAERQRRILKLSTAGGALRDSNSWMG